MYGVYTRHRSGRIRSLQVIRVVIPVRTVCRRMQCNVTDLLSLLKVVIVAAPAYAHSDLLRGVAPFVEKGAAVGALFAQVIILYSSNLDSTQSVISARNGTAVVGAVHYRV